MQNTITTFDDLAARWDAMLTDSDSFVNYQESSRRFHWFLKRALKIGNRTKSYRLLDLGCGTGEASWPLWKRVHSVTFFDASMQMLRLARNKYPKGIFMRGHAEALPFLDAEFDVVISRGCLIGTLKPMDVVAMLEGVYRTLRPGGYFLFDFPTGAEWPGAPEELTGKGGWKRPDMEELIHERMPGAAILAYDGTDVHAVNRVVIRKA